MLTTEIVTTCAILVNTDVRHPGSSEWTLDVGALALSVSDGGVWCIDEFRCIICHGGGSNHESMEDHTLSVPKDGLLYTLGTRATVTAAIIPQWANPKSGNIYIFIYINWWYQ